MRLTRPPILARRRMTFGDAAVASWFMAIVCFSLFATSLGAACTAGQRQDTLRAALIAANSTRDAYVAWDLRHQQDIIDTSDTRETAERRLVEYHAKQDTMASHFTLVYQGIALASVEASDKKVEDAVRLVQDLIASFKALKGR